MIKVSIIGNGKFGSKIRNIIKDVVEFAEPHDADWIIIATPNDLHYEQVEKWLGKRKNVFCEKPLTLTVRAAKELFDLAYSMGVKLYVDDVFHWHKKININKESNTKFKFYKYGSFKANLIDNLAYHHFYLWTDIEDFEIKEMCNEYYNSYCMRIVITLEDDRKGTFDYNILADKYEHTIENDWNTTIVESEDYPIRDMLLSVFQDQVNFDNNSKRTLNAIKLCEAVKKEVLKKVLVVGGGIFGTTAATMLATSGYNVTLHEELEGIMKCASDINQYRLHKGYHYPRSKETTQECLSGLKLFKRKYKDSIVNENADHYYAIAKENSLVTSDEYLKYLDDMKLSYNIVKPIKKADLTVQVDEELFDSGKLKEQSIKKIKGVGVNLVLNKQTTKEDFDDYDYVIIATYAKINELLDNPKKYQYEVVEKPVVRLPNSYENKSVVIMDGPFMCFDPYKSGLHVLGHVKHAIHTTSIGQYPREIDKYIVGYLNSGIIENPKITNIQKFIDSGMEYFEDFDKLKHIGSMFTIRTVLPNRDQDDARPTIVTKETDKIFTIFSGKIGTCVESANRLVKMLKETI